MAVAESVDFIGVSSRQHTENDYKRPCSLIQNPGIGTLYAISTKVLCREL
jgi:hypothetical protein